jgi:uncharacterized protein (TIGR02594 family)
MNITAFDLAQRFVGAREVPGALRNPQIMAMLQLDNKWPEDDSVAWCSAFVNYIAWLLRLPRSKDLRARSWLNVGRPVFGKDLTVGFDIAILSRTDNDPDETVIDAPGHVGFYGGFDKYPPEQFQNIYILGGNQDDSVNITMFPVQRILGLRRLYEQ